MVSELSDAASLKSPSRYKQRWISIKIKMHCGFIVISGWNSSGCNSMIIKVAFCMLPVKCVCVRSCPDHGRNILKFPVFSCSTAVCIKGVCALWQVSQVSFPTVTVASLKPPPLTCSRLSLLRHHSSPISTLLHGFTVLGEWMWSKRALLVSEVTIQIRGRLVLYRYKKSWLQTKSL